MAKAKKLLGRDLMIFVDGKCIALSTQCEITTSSNITKDGTKDDGMYDDAEVDTVDWSISNDSIATADESRSIDTVYDILLDKQQSRQKVELMWGTAANNKKDGSELPEEGWTAPTKGRKGSAFIESLKLTGAKEGNAKMNATFKGVGPIKKIEG